MRIQMMTVALAFVAASTSYADPLTCNLTAYKAMAGLTAVVNDNTLVVSWEGDNGAELRMGLGIDRGTPTIRELAIRKKGGQWATLATNVTPEFRVVSGLRRITNQQLIGLREAGVEITQELIDEWKWNAFWDAPLSIPGDATAHGYGPAPAEGILNQPGLPRKPEEIKRATATYRAQSCEVKTDGTRLGVTFPGVELGVFSGRLEYTVFKGTNLIRQAVVAKTDEPSVAYKYDAGFKGLAVRPASRVMWRDLANNWQNYRFDGANNEGPVALKSSNRVVFAEVRGGSIGAFPPPHTFFWGREIMQNLGYSWHRKDSDASFSFGIRQAELEEDPENRENFALYNARPGTWQRMPVFFYVSAEPAEAALGSVLAFTHGDHYKPLPGYQVMAHHVHMDLVGRLRQSGSLDAEFSEFDILKAVGINIISPIDRARGVGEERLKGQADYFEAARRHSDKNFLVMPNSEDLGPLLGGDTDILLSKPVFWSERVHRGERFVEEHPIYGTVYRVSGPAEIMEMAKRENALIFGAHSRSKDSTGYPDAIKDRAWFINERYRGFASHWGMGIDRSETRLCEYRCLALLDDMNNWVADLPTPAKFFLGMFDGRTNLRAVEPSDDVYASWPVNYVQVDSLPGPRDWSPILDALRRGEYFFTSGEVLIPSYAVEGTGNQRTITAEVEWTFPLDFVEVVWGDGHKTDRQIISATDLPPFGRHRFEIPFNAAGKKWVRFAAWDSAGNGALVQPIKLHGEMTSTTVR
jgi:hypothetical protein